MYKTSQFGNKDDLFIDNERGMKLSFIRIFLLLNVYGAPVNKLSSSQTTLKRINNNAVVP